MTAPLAGTRVFLVLLNAPLFGSERLMIRTAATLKTQGADVMVAACHWEFGGIRKALDLAGVPHVDIFMRGHFTRRGGPARVARLLFEALRSAMRVRAACRRFRPTHIVVPDESNFLYAIPSLLGRGRVRGLFVPANVPDGARAARSRVYRFFFKHVIGRLTDAAVANSQFTSERLAAVLPAGFSISIVRCCAPDRPNAGSDPALDTVRRDRLNVVFVGQLAAHKGVDLLLEAALRMVGAYPEMDVLFAGPIDDRSDEADAWRRRVRDSGHSDRIRFLGAVEDVPELMRRAAVHVMPSRCEESFGLVVVEAKQQGVPSVVFPVGALPELVRHQVDGYVCRDVSVDALVEGLRYFLDDAGRRGAAGAEAAAVADRYSSDQFGRAWVQVLTDGRLATAAAGETAIPNTPRQVHARPHRHA